MTRLISILEIMARTLLVGTLMILMLSACSVLAGYRVRTVQINGDTFMALKDIAGYYSLKYEVDGKSLRLSSKVHVLRLTLDRREAHLDGILTHFSIAPQLWHRAAVISETDFRVLLDPVLRPQSIPRSQIRNIVLDPGHGGNDQGTSNRHYLEKDLTGLVARRVADMLRQQGFTVTLTRNSDRTLTLEQRVAIAVRQEADLFISFHANSAADQTVNGIETFLVPPKGTASTYDQRVWQSKKRGNQFDRENSRLAFDIHRSLLAACRAEDRGIKHANFLVIREAPCPAVLVEMGFMSNTGEERQLGNAAYQERLAAGIAAGVQAYQRIVSPKR